MNTINRETGEDDMRISPCSRLISIIVPVYNTAQWLRRCLDSICAQSYRNLEILCVNDGSTDNSAEILAEYAAKDARIRVFTQENAGLSAARNTALEHATGEWVTGVDSDDYLAPDAVEHAVEQIQEGVDMVCMQLLLVDEADNPIPDKSGYYTLPTESLLTMTPALAGRLNVCFAGKLWSRSFIETHQLRFPYKLVHEDVAFYSCAISLLDKVAFCARPGYYYLQRRGSIMHRKVMLDERIARITAIFRYVAAEYCRLGINLGMSSYFAIMFHGSYGALYRCVSEPEQEIVRDGFNRLAVELGLQRCGTRDYRLLRLRPQSRISRLFVQRYLNSMVVRFCKVPLWGVEYDSNGKFLRLHFLLLNSLIGAVRRFFTTIEQGKG